MDFSNVSSFIKDIQILEYCIIKPEFRNFKFIQSANLKVKKVPNLVQKLNLILENVKS